ncbi:hypothetical protein [Kitasatospora sp. NE20-6]|uniref:hypothetical protein n=1 Tax=Kitasatospora sp. NE20-6 TaxID=2859066 RepID=UPI0038B39F53
MTVFEGRIQTLPKLSVPAHVENQFRAESEIQAKEKQREISDDGPALARAKPSAGNC